MFAVGDNFHSQQLKEEAMNFAVMNFEAVITSSDFAELCKANPLLVAEFNLAHAERMKEHARPAKKKKS